MAPDAPKTVIDLHLRFTATIISILLISLLILWAIGPDVANQLGDCVREFIAAKNGLR